MTASLHTTINSVIMKKSYLWLGIGGSLLTIPSVHAEKKAKKSPNVVFIIADDLGYGDISCYGAHRVQTPNVDKLAASGIRFTDAHAVASTSTPSRYSLFTGHYAWRRNDTGIARGDAGMIIRPEQFTIADMFRNAGYTTGAIGKWHLGLGDKTGTQDWNRKVTPGPADIGFDYSCLMAATGDRVPCVWMENQRVLNYDASAPIEVSYTKPFEGEPTGKKNPELLYNLKPSVNHGHDQAIVNGISRIGFMKGGGKALWKDEEIADTIISKTVNFIERNSDKPFFLYVGTNDVHVPRFPHARFRGKSGMGYRGDAILQFDYTIGKIIDALEQQGIRENTLIIVSSDNGPVVDDGYQDRAVELLGDHRPWGDLRGGKYSSFEAGTRIPFIVNWPAEIKKGKISNALVSQIDLFASMADLVGQKLQPGEGVDSQNFLKAFLGKDSKGRPYVVEASSSLAISDGRWKYITPSKGAAFMRLTRIETGNAPTDQLYDLKNDRGEKVNLAEKYPKEVERLKSQLKQVRENK